MPRARPESRDKLIGATIDVVRAKGYNATRVEDICAAAGVTKGSFFHHFPSKDALALAATAAWNEAAARLFAEADFHAAGDPLDRLVGYVAFRKAAMAGDFTDCSCFAGTVIQETYQTHPELTAACERGIDMLTAMLTTWIEAAVAHHGRRADWSAGSLALHMQAVVQGSFILAKASGDWSAARAALDHLARYVDMLIRRPPET